MIFINATQVKQSTLKYFTLTKDWESGLFEKGRRQGGCVVKCAARQESVIGAVSVVSEEERAAASRRRTPTCHSVIAGIDAQPEPGGST